MSHGLQQPATSLLGCAKSLPFGQHLRIFAALWATWPNGPAFPCHSGTRLHPCSTQRHVHCLSRNALEAPKSPCPIQGHVSKNARCGRSTSASRPHLEQNTPVSVLQNYPFSTWAFLEFDEAPRWQNCASPATLKLCRSLLEALRPDEHIIK